jgi:hypothetical protein
MLTIVATVAVSLVFATAAFAFAAANTVPATTSGSGSNTISGYTITNVSYGLDTTTPTNIDTVTFTLSPAAATTVKIQLVTGGSWYSCTDSTGSVSCTTTGATVAAANSLTVVASQ